MQKNQSWCNTNNGNSSVSLFTLETKNHGPWFCTISFWNKYTYLLNNKKYFSLLFWQRTIYLYFCQITKIITKPKIIKNKEKIQKKRIEGWNTKKPHLKSLNFFQENSLDAGIQDRRTSISILSIIERLRDFHHLYYDDI